jgi:hypothetical protein
MNFTNKLSITIEPTKSVFNRLVCNEPVDINLLNKLINSDLLKETCHGPNALIYESERELLIKYSALVKDGYAKILYSKEKKKIGRCTAYRGMSYLGIRREIRHTLAGHTMTDVDIDSCHPVLMLQMLKNYGYKSTYLKDYVDNRADWLIMARKHWSIDRDYIINQKHSAFLVDSAKKPDEEHVFEITEEQIASGLKDIVKALFLRLMYHGKCRKWVEENGLDKNIPIHPKIAGFVNEFKEIGEIFMKENKTLIPIIIKKNIAKNKVDSEGKARNVVGSLCSTVMQAKENMVLEHIYKYMVFTKVIKNNVCTLCADGIMVDKENFKPEVLMELKGYIFSMTGFCVNMSCKEMDQGYKNVDAHVIGKPYVQSPLSNNLAEAIEDMADNSMFDRYVNSIYYNATFEITKTTEKNIKLCSKDFFACNVCDCEHREGGNRVLSINDNGNIFIKCHTIKKLVYKSKKGRDLERIQQKVQIDNAVNEFFTLDTTDIKVIQETTRYLGCDDKHTFVWKPEYNAKFLILNSQMGKGKTSFVSKYFDRMTFVDQNCSILFVSQRKTFTDFICDDFKKYQITNYQDIKDNDYNKNRICIQVESLHKISRNYDIVVLDEIETILNNYSSATMTKVRDSWQTLLDCIANCKHCITADAFILQRSIDFVKELSGRSKNSGILMIHNTKPYLENRKAIQLSQDLFDSHLIDNLKNKKRIVNISSSRDDLLNVYSKITAQTDTTAKIYERNTDNSDLKNVNETWKMYDYIGYTPVIQTGISYMDIPFDLCYANLKSSNLVRDAMQMLMRCRKLNDNIMYFSVNKRQIYNTTQINMFSTYDTFMDDRISKTAILISELNGNVLQNATIIKSLLHSLTVEDPLLLKMIWHNLREQMLSQCHYNSMCFKMLQMQGYDVVNIKEGDHDLDRKKDKSQEDLVDEYMNIGDITYDELHRFKNDSTISVSDRLRVDRYYFENLLVKDLCPLYKAPLFYKFFQVSHMKEKLYNIRHEKNSQNISELIINDYDKSDTLVSKMKMTNSKLNHIRQLNKLIGFDNSCHNDLVIDKSVIKTSVLTYVAHHIKDLQCIFNSKAKINGSNDVFNCLKIIQKIYRSWSGMEIKKNEKTKKETKSYISEVNDFYNCIKCEEQEVDPLVIMECDAEGG